MATIHTPVKGFCGVVAGVRFEDGVGSSEDEPALSYFRRHAYTITEANTDADAAEPKPTGDITSSENEQSQDPPPADNEHVADGAELFEPKGNASVEEWRAYAVQQGKEAAEVAELKREEIKALLEG